MEYGRDPRHAFRILPSGGEDVVSLMKAMVDVYSDATTRSLDSSHGQGAASGLGRGMH